MREVSQGGRNQPSAAPSGNGNRDQSGSREMQVEGQAPQGILPQWSANHLLGQPLQLLRPSTAANRGALLFWETHQKVDFLSTAFAPMPLVSRPPEHENVRARRGGRLYPNAADETTCLRPNVPTGHKVSPDPTTTESKTLQVELQPTPQPTSANQKRATNRRNQALLFLLLIVCDGHNTLGFRQKRWPALMTLRPDAQKNVEDILAATAPELVGLPALR